jgi:uncharacterized phage protein (TIGR01671 family)
MRGILFRGKAINRNKGYHRTKYKNGDWVYGLLTRLYDERFENLPAEMTNTDGVSRIEIDHNTVGQYTGLTDKNGTKIFEGDILKIARVSDSIGSYYFPPLDYPVNVIVKWDMCAWMWETLCEDKRYIGFPDAWCHYECEVIGNIHDNPELLKGGE